WAATSSWPSKGNGPEPLNRATIVGRVCPQAGAAGTKGARPLGGRSVGKSQASRQIRRCSTIRDLCSLKAALLSPGKNLRKKTTISDIVIQRADASTASQLGALRTDAP